MVKAIKKHVPQAVLSKVEKTAPPKIAFRDYIKGDEIQQKFVELIGHKAIAFLVYIADIVEADKRLMVADNDSILNAAAQSLNLDLSLDTNLGLAYITAYKDRTRGNKIMAHYMISRGIAILNFDKRGAGDSGEAPWAPSATTTTTGRDHHRAVWDTSPRPRT